MAERRMFTQKIVDSDAFLDMPLSAQALYFHLNMRADDDGFVNNPRRIQRTVCASEDDLKLLILKRFLICFESGVIVIKHWRMHNSLRKDRYNPTQYQDEFARLGIKDNGSYTERKALPDTLPEPEEDPATTWQPDGDQMEPQDRVGKDRIGQDRSGKESEGEVREKINYQQIVDLYHDTCVSFPRLRSLSDNRKKAIRARLKTYNMEDFRLLFEKAEASSFLKGKNPRNWSADFDWLITDKYMAKTLDGCYDDRPGYGPAQGARSGGNGFETSNPFLEMLHEERGYQ